MKNHYILSLITILALATLTASSALATDEFGERFYSQAPVGLEGYPEEPEDDFLISDEAAAALNDILPAAGEETETQPEDTQSDQITPTQPKTLREKLESIRAEKANDSPR